MATHNLTNKKNSEKTMTKIIINYFQSHHNMHDGLLAEDHKRISSDLEKIAEMELLCDNPKDKEMYSLGIRDSRTATVLLRHVKIICNTNFGSGRLTGYKIEDEINNLYAYGKDDIKQMIKKWHSDATSYGNPPYKIGTAILSLKDLDSMFGKNNSYKNSTSTSI